MENLNLISTPWFESSSTENSPRGEPELPFEILAYIFSYIKETRTRDNICLVCRKWRQVILSHTFKIKLRPPQHLSTPPSSSSTSPCTSLSSSPYTSIFNSGLFNPARNLPSENSDDNWEICFEREDDFQEKSSETKIANKNQIDLSSSPQKNGNRGFTALISPRSSSNSQTYLPESVQVFRFLVSNFPRVRKIDLSNWKYVSTHSLTSFSACKQLNTLKLDNCSITDDKVASLCYTLTDLTKLYLGSSKITNHSLSKISLFLTKIITLNLSSCLLITNAGLQSLVSLSSLTSLSLNNCYQLDIASVCDFLSVSDPSITNSTSTIISSSSTIPTPISHTSSISGLCENLLKLSVSRLEHTEGSIIKIQKFSNLLELDLSSCYRFHSSTLSILLLSLTNLTSLNLNQCKQITHNTILTICSNGDINSVNRNVRGGRRNSSSSLGRNNSSRNSSSNDSNMINFNNNNNNNTSLTSLSIGNCIYLPNESLNNISQSLKRLKSLEIYWCSFSCTSLVSLSQLECLEKLNVSWCKSLDNYVLTSLSTLSSLTHLNLTGCSQITDTGIVEFCRNSKSKNKLTTLSLGDCISLTNISIFHISRTFSLSLTSLDLTNCANLTDAAFLDLSSSLTLIHKLSLINCVCLSDHAFSILSLSLPFLSFLDVSGCIRLTESSHLSFLRFHPRVTLLSNGCFTSTTSTLSSSPSNSMFLSSSSSSSSLSPMIPSSLQFGFSFTPRTSPP